MFILRMTGCIFYRYSKFGDQRFDFFDSNLYRIKRDRILENGLCLFHNTLKKK